MFTRRKTKAFEYLTEIIENYCRMRLANDKVISGVLSDMECRLAGIDGTLIEVGLSQINIFEKTKRSDIMIKGYIKPDGTILASNMIVEGSNRTAALMCFEIGLIVGINEKNQLIRMENGQQKIISSMAIENVEVKKETSNVNQDQPAEPDLPATDLPATDLPESQIGAEKHPGGGIASRK